MKNVKTDSISIINSKERSKSESLISCNKRYVKNIFMTRKIILLFRSYFVNCKIAPNTVKDINIPEM
jgi:hypothetical protein